MSAPPVLRPLRAILQRRLQIVPSRATRTPYYLRTSHYRSQLRYNSSTPPDQPPKPDELAREASSEPTPQNETPSITNHTKDPQNPTKGSPDGNAEANGVTNSDVSGQDVGSDAAVPRLDNLLVQSAFQKLKRTDAEIQAGIAEAVARQLAVNEATTDDVGDAPVLESVVAETPASETRPAVEADSDFVVDPIPDTPSPVEAAIKTATQETERIDKTPEATDKEPELPSVPESRETAPITNSPEQSDTLESAVAAEKSRADPEEGLSVDSRLDAMRDAEPEQRDPEVHAKHVENAEQLGKDEASFVDSSLSGVQDAELEKRDQEEHAERVSEEATLSVDSSLNAIREKELEKRDREDHAAQLSKDPEDDAAMREALGEIGGDGFYEGPEPSRTPRNVAAYYLQPLRRVAEYGVPACDLQLRSYSIRPLESFCDFALRAAYYLGLPAYGPVPLPKLIKRWTVPRSSFIFKKSQENFERITRRRLIQIKDANPETVQIWLAFLQKHQQAAVGMKANLWEFSSIDVAKQMDEAFKEAEPLINDKYRLLQQNKEFESVEKVDVFLQATRYRVTGDQGQRKL